MELYQPMLVQAQAPYLRFRGIEAVPTDSGEVAAMVQERLVRFNKTAGEVVESYTMLTLNADHHALMSRMHKPDPRLGPDLQDKRSVVPIELADVDAWLFGSPGEAATLVRLAPVDAFDAAPVRG
jgi:putative SOS response-associated peptidase YedK